MSSYIYSMPDDKLFFSKLVTKNLRTVDSNRRLFEGILTVEMKDKQGEITVRDELLKVLPIWIARGGPITDTHSNRVVGQGINFGSTCVVDKEGKSYPAITITGEIFKDYELDNEIWKSIKSGKYKGLSFGGATKSARTPIMQKDGSMAYSLKDLEQYEVAVCEEPAVPLALITQHNEVAKAMAGNVKDRGDGTMCIRCDKFKCYVEKGDDSFADVRGPNTPNKDDEAEALENNRGEPQENGATYHGTDKTYRDPDPTETDPKKIEANALRASKQIQVKDDKAIKPKDDDEMLEEADLEEVEKILPLIGMVASRIGGAAAGAARGAAGAARGAARGAAEELAPGPESCGSSCDMTCEDLCKADGIEPKYTEDGKDKYGNKMPKFMHTKPSDVDTGQDKPGSRYSTVQPESVTPNRSMTPDQLKRRQEGNWNKPSTAPPKVGGKKIKPSATVTHDHKTGTTTIDSSTSRRGSQGTLTIPTETYINNFTKTLDVLKVLFAIKADELEKIANKDADKLKNPYFLKTDYNTCEEVREYKDDESDDGSKDEDSKKKALDIINDINNILKTEQKLHARNGTSNFIHGRHFVTTNGKISNHDGMASHEEQVRRIGHKNLSSFLKETGAARVTHNDKNNEFSVHTHRPMTSHQEKTIRNHMRDNKIDERKVIFDNYHDKGPGETGDSHTHHSKIFPKGNHNNMTDNILTDKATDSKKTETIKLMDELKDALTNRWIETIPKEGKNTNNMSNSQRFGRQSTGARFNQDTGNKRSGNKWDKLGDLGEFKDSKILSNEGEETGKISNQHGGGSKQNALSKASGDSPYTEPGRGGFAGREPGETCDHNESTSIHNVNQPKHVNRPYEDEDAEALKKEVGDVYHPGNAKFDPKNHKHLKELGIRFADAKETNTNKKPATSSTGLGGDSCSNFSIHETVSNKNDRAMTANNAEDGINGKMRLDNDPPAEALEVEKKVQTGDYGNCSIEVEGKNIDAEINPGESLRKDTAIMDPGSGAGGIRTGASYDNSQQDTGQKDNPREVKEENYTGEEDRGNLNPKYSGEDDTVSGASTENYNKATVKMLELLADIKKQT